MKLLYELVGILVAGAVTENLLFARALGADRIPERTRNYRNIFWFGALYCFASTLGGAMAWGLRFLLSRFSWWITIRGMAVLLCICAAYFTMLLVVGTNRVRSALSLPVAAAFNGASFGSVFIAIANHDTVLQVIFYCVGCSIGLTAAMMLIHSGRERLELCNVPKAFSGIPITMIYIGILSLAIYGLLGHQLPT